MIEKLLDTNICVYLINKRPRHLEKKFEEMKGRLAVSVISYAELLFGAARSANPEKNYRAIKMLTDRLHVLPFEENAAHHFALIRAELSEKGTPISTYDLLIAAHARSERLTIVTNNEKEFRRVPKLEVENWTVV